MPKFFVNVSGYASYGILVEADTEEEAREKWEDAEKPALCVNCSGYTSHDDELDTPQDVQFEDSWEITSVEER